MPKPTKLHTDDFIEMLMRGDTPLRIATYAGIQVDSVERRFHRLPDDVKNLILLKNNGAMLWK